DAVNRRAAANGSAARASYHASASRGQAGRCSGQPGPVVGDQKVPGLLVLLDAAEAGDAGIVEDVVGVVVVDGRDLADEDVAALAPEGVPVLVGHERHAFAGLEPELAAGRQGVRDAVAVDGDAFG